jgi:hypothetical protein
MPNGNADPVIFEKTAKLRDEQRQEAPQPRIEGQNDWHRIT